MAVSLVWVEAGKTQSDGQRKLPLPCIRNGLRKR